MNKYHVTVRLVCHAIFEVEAGDAAAAEDVIQDVGFKGVERVDAQGVTHDALLVCGVRGLIWGTMPAADTPQLAIRTRVSRDDGEKT